MSGGTSCVDPSSVLDRCGRRKKFLVLAGEEIVGQNLNPTQFLFNPNCP